jgi:hypothetical protein
LEDFGIAGKGWDVELISADHQNKPDVGVSIAKQWLDRDGVDAIVDVPTSSVGLAVNTVTRISATVVNRAAGIHLEWSRNPEMGSVPWWMVPAFNGGTIGDGGRHGKPEIQGRRMGNLQNGGIPGDWGCRAAPTERLPKLSCCLVFAFLCI